jgi:cytochrome c-type biogenesis protein CcmH
MGNRDDGGLKDMRGALLMSGPGHRRRPILAVVVLLTLAMMSSGAHAVTPDEVLKDPGLEKRARGLSQQLRCLVCQNQSIDDSDAPLARDLRLLVRERLSRGDSDTAAIEFIVARYGTFVLLKPPFQRETLLLWLAPLLLLLAAIAGFRRQFGRKAEAVSPSAALTDAETRRVSELLEEKKRG